MIDQIALTSLLTGIEHIGALSTITTKIFRMITDSDYDTTHLADVISRDPAISAQLLKIANSAYFQRSEPIKTIKQAIVTLGLQNVKGILYGIQMFGIFKGKNDPKNFDIMTFYKHTIAGAVIASQYKIPQGISITSDNLYIAGLLRNLGVLAIRQFIPTTFGYILSLMETDKLSFANAAMYQIGNGHRYVTYTICKNWKLPDSMIDAYTNDDDITLESKTIRDAIKYADDLLQATHYATWDMFYMPNFLDTTMPNREIYDETTKIIDSISDLL